MFQWSKAEATVLPIALLITLVLALAVTFLTRKKSETLKKIPLMIIITAMIGMEIAKQIYYVKAGYDTWAIPLHFCSLFMYVYFGCAFFKGKIGNVFKCLSLCMSLLFIVIFYCYPSSVIGESTSNIFKDFLSAHTFIYHHLIFLFFFILLFSNIYKKSKFDYLYACIAIIVYAAVAVPIAHTLDTNFCFILYNEIPILESIRQSYGQIFYTIILMLLGIIGLELAILVLHLCFYRRKKKTDMDIIMSAIKS